MENEKVYILKIELLEIQFIDRKYFQFVYFYPCEMENADSSRKIFQGYKLLYSFKLIGMISLFP